jgi:hypothetical protein
MAKPFPIVPTSEYGDSLMTIRDFAARYPHLYANAHRVRWLVRDRGSNGLTDYGAVVSVFNAGERPSVYIHVGNWFAWMQAGGSRGSRPTATLASSA